MLLTAMSVISPFGLGVHAFTEGVRQGRCQLSTVDPEWGVPHQRAGVVENFDPAETLTDTKSLRMLDRAAGLATCTLTLLAKENDFTHYAPGKRGVVLGGHLICADRSMDLTIGHLTAKLPFQTDTKAFPSSVANHSAAQCAIRFQMQGPNTTLNSGRLTGLSSMAYAKRLWDRGRAEVLFVAAVEDLTRHRAWLTYHGHGKGSTEPLGEGCAMFMVESAEAAAAGNRKPVGEVLSVEHGWSPDSDGTQAALAKQIRRALDRAGVTASAVRTAVVSGPGATAELAAVGDVLGSGPRVLEPASLIGDTDGASAAFQLATAVAQAPADGELAIVTSTDSDGQVGCGVFRVFGTP